jgi:hypothetical protein
MTQAAHWGNWRPQVRSGEEAKRVRAWFRHVACPSCNAAIGRACRTATGHPTDHHRARRDATGPPPYEEWRKQGLIQTPRSAAIPTILKESHTACGHFGVDQPLEDAVAIVSHLLADRLGIGLGDDSALDRFDDAARALVLARGPIGSADLVTVLASQVATLLGMISGPYSAPETVFTNLIREQVNHTRRQQALRKSLSE